MTIRSRREFLKSSVKSVTALGAVGAMAKFGEISAFASTGGTGYQALVCIFLSGGNDGHNTIIPISTAQQNYSLYQTGRKSLALAQSSLLPIFDGSDVYGLHPAIPELQQLYKQGKAAVLANVGNLVQPLNRSGYQSNNSALFPTALFSHSDQSNQWQSAIPNGIASTGWGGRITDLLRPQNSSAIFPPITTTSTCGLFCSGQQTSPATVPPPATGAPAGSGMATLRAVNNAPATAGGMQQLLTFDNGLQLVQAGNGIISRGSAYANTMTGLLANVKLTTPFPSSNPLAAQLQTVANVMSVRNQLGLTRQIFFCQLNGFDTHSAQLQTHQQLLSQLSQAMLAFYQATEELGIDQSVTTFTASEFGRTLTPSGTNGSDHAWGNHHFILGGNVQGGKFYGQFPLLSLGGNQDANMRGTLIPTTAVAQYGATLAKWFGVSSGSLTTVFPNINNFATANVGFLG
ncbi:MAG: DUF1501 domain-containing protein [Acidobacteriaceae bacterium]